METPDVIKMLTWINSVDGRVALNEPAVDMWSYAMRQVDPAVAKQAVLEHYKQHENIAASPAAIAKRAANIRASREAGQRALDASPKPVRHPLSWRTRNPEEWDRLFEQGRREGNALRAAASKAREGVQDQEWAA